MWSSSISNEIDISLPLCTKQWGVLGALICYIKFCVEEVIIQSVLFGRKGNLIKGNGGIF